MLVVRWHARRSGFVGLDCSANSPDEVAKCNFGPKHPSNPCSLHRYRFGKNPHIKLTEENKAARAERARQALRCIP
jgi:hypothetical protein